MLCEEVDVHREDVVYGFLCKCCPVEQDPYSGMIKSDSTIPMRSYELAGSSG